jgi:hypothetical protein
MTAPNSNNLTFDTTPDDHARLKEIFKNDHSAQKIDHAKFSLAPGVVVPGSIRLSPLPETISNIQPTWQGSEYFRLGRSKVVIVDPRLKRLKAFSRSHPLGSRNKAAGRGFCLLFGI